jgi:hypothetical protein
MRTISSGDAVSLPVALRRGTGDLHPTAPSPERRVGRVGQVRRLLLTALGLWVAGAGGVAAQRSAVPARLEVELIVAGKESELLGSWAAGEAGVTLETDTEVRPGDPIIVQVRIRGCRADPTGRCDVTVQYAASAPDGRVIREPKAMPVQRDARPASLRFSLSAADPSGLYRVSAIVRDLHAKQIVRVERIFGLRLEDVD